VRERGRVWARERERERHVNESCHPTRHAMNHDDFTSRVSGWIVKHTHSARVCVYVCVCMCVCAWVGGCGGVFVCVTHLRCAKTCFTNEQTKIEERESESACVCVGEEINLGPDQKPNGGREVALVHHSLLAPAGVRVCDIWMGRAHVCVTVISKVYQI